LRRSPVSDGAFYMKERLSNGVKLGVNVDHAATLRRARGTAYPDPVLCAVMAQAAGCDSIVMHLREDRRHVQERDILIAKKVLKIPLNLEMSIAKSIVAFACRAKVVKATLVPEKRAELTTEGGLDVAGGYGQVKKAVDQLKQNNIRVSVFIEADKRQILAAKKIGADAAEFHTGHYCDLSGKKRAAELKRIKAACAFASQQGLFIAAGHGLDYNNVKALAAIKQVRELNIGHSIICRALYVGMGQAVKEMMSLI